MTIVMKGIIKRNMDLWPEDLKEQLDEVLEFAQCLREKGLWRDDMKVYKDKNGNLIAE